MRILVTGHRGNVGVPVARHLADLGYEVVGFDRVDGEDLLDLSQVKDAAAGCTAVVHLGALAHDSAGSPEQIMAVNVLGTWHTLLAAEAAGAERVEYGAFVDVRDVAGAAELALEVPLTGHHRATLCAATIAATQPALDMAARLAPDVTVKDSARYRADPWRALVDCSAAEAILGWRPRYRWSRRGVLPPSRRVPPSR